ncbi:copper/silver efflux system membrane fusion protein CusB [Shimia thalassica]|uniref:Copper/silver efflux system membrane fusion protein CusB n=1 Tax=Shimia thalassica TaxID=1715693 RepID=A0A0P1IEI0_9RHOB|nr:efflux RND transporter periplasmic adaptor subunit [Shimia thalassica]CUJ94400.1 copper/silver efflux system membrane fusion protein CusB [Shimia thalassica]
MLRTLKAGACLILCPLPVLALEVGSCIAVPSQVIDVSVEFPGLVETVLVDRGSTVVEGDLLVKLRDSSIRAQVALAARRAEDLNQINGVKARIEVLEAQLVRVESLYERNLIAQREVDRVDAELLALYQERDRLFTEHDLAKIEHARVQELMTQRAVKSTIEGLVTARNIDPGEYASEQAPLLTIAALDPLYVEIFVPQSMAGKLAIGDEVEVLLNTAPETPLVATVDVIDQVFDAASATFGMRLVLPNPDGALPAGVRCRARL